jgi:hypothetical protein
MKKTQERKLKSMDANRDPITGSPGAHPVGTGAGAAAGGAAGGAIGAIGGPVGAAVGIAAGAVAGGLAGKAIAEEVDPTVELEYWEAHYKTRPYVRPESPFDDYEPAYRTGYEGWFRYHGDRYEDVEHKLRKDYESKSNLRLKWENAKDAVRDAWDRLADAVSEDDDVPKDSNRQQRAFRDKN